MTNTVPGVDAFGTQLQVGDGATPEAFMSIANVTNIVPPSIKRDAQDRTAHDTPDGWKVFAPAKLKDLGEFSIDINYDPMAHDALTDQFSDELVRSWRVVFPTTPPTMWAFAGFSTGFEAKAPIGDKLAASVKFKASGKPTIS
jgi:hypothetical protein